jgi:two-component system chemotaxis response regulator CheB
VGSETKRAGVRDIVAIGASAGGIEAILKILGELSADFPASVFVVIHLSPESKSVLPEIIFRKTGFRAVHPENNQRVETGVVYLAPPDYHMTVHEGRIAVEKGPRENRHRPAIDPLFRSVAVSYGSRAIGIILTGSLDDGTAGLQAIKMCGGIAIVQHPEDALFPGMPENALRSVDVDHCVPMAKISGLLKELVGERVEAKNGADCNMPALDAKAKPKTMTPREMMSKLGPPSGFVCPECNGPLWELNEGKTTHFRCLVGHQFSPESFLVEETEALERSLWVAAKTLEERVTLLNRLAAKATSVGQTTTATSFRQKADESEEHVEVIRKMIGRLQS